MNAHGEIELPILIAIENTGGTEAHGFALKTSYIVPEGTFEATFNLTRIAFEEPVALRPLASGTSMIIYGNVVFPEKAVGRMVALKAQVLCCRIGQDSLAHEHIEEQYADNNESLPIQVSLHPEDLALDHSHSLTSRVTENEAF